MPGMSGLELLAAARRRAPETRRLLVSGYADFESALDAINEVGIDRLLTKPWQNEEVRGAVDGALKVARLQRENVRVTDELRRRTEELERVNQRLDALVEERTSNLLDGLVSALDLRDSETQWHSRRVGRYARRLARELGIEGRELDDIERGATLHDIGKIGVRDAVLLKPGPLDDKEWAEMRRHPALGYDILKGIGFLERARLIPLHHQERFDGTGYPAGARAATRSASARASSPSSTPTTPSRATAPTASAAPTRSRAARSRPAPGTQLDPAVVAQWLRITAGRVGRHPRGARRRRRRRRRPAAKSSATFETRPGLDEVAEGGLEERVLVLVAAARACARAWRAGSRAAAPRPSRRRARGAARRPAPPGRSGDAARGRGRS